MTTLTEALNLRRASILSSKRLTKLMHRTVALSFRFPGLIVAGELDGLNMFVLFTKSSCVNAFRLRNLFLLILLNTPIVDVLLFFFVCV